jgi:hypothetical protein
MENVIDLIATDTSPAEISDAIKSLLYAKAAERIEAAKPIVASGMFSGDEVEQEEEQEE